MTLSTKMNQAVTFSVYANVVNVGDEFEKRKNGVLSDSLVGRSVLKCHLTWAGKFLRWQSYLLVIQYIITYSPYFPPLTIYCVSFAASPPLRSQVVHSLALPCVWSVLPTLLLIAFSLYSFSFPKSAKLLAFIVCIWGFRV